MSDSTNHFRQAQQRVSDAWRSVIGSTGFTIVNAFFESNTQLKTDEERQLFAQQGLENNRFLYSNTKSQNPKVGMLTGLRCIHSLCVAGIQRCLLWSVRLANVRRSPQCYSRCNCGSQSARCRKSRQRWPCSCSCFGACRCVFPSHRLPLVSIGATCLHVVGNWGDYTANDPGCQAIEEQNHHAPKDHDPQRRH